MNPDRRTLSFSSLDEVVPDAERLLGGYRQAGQWTLGQVCRHLSVAFRATAVTPPDHDPNAQATEEQARNREAFERDGIPENLPIRNTRSLPPEGLDDRAEIDNLRESIGVFLASEGPGPIHPRLGPLTREEWIRFHCLHCAHHLSFLTPSVESAHA